MTLSPDRRRAYTAGALTGAFAALALVAERRPRRLALAALSLGCGALSVHFEERATGADTDAGRSGSDPDGG